MPHGLDTGPASGLLEGSVLAQPSTQLTGRCVIERAPIKIELMGLDSRSSQRLPLTLLSGRPLPDPSLRAARSRGHRNLQNHEPYQKLGPPPASLQVTHTVARVSDKAPCKVHRERWVATSSPINRA